MSGAQAENSRVALLAGHPPHGNVGWTLVVKTAAEIGLA
jgi:hypothetical protein